MLFRSKLLDASFVLAEQAHHDDRHAAACGLADPGKTEAWYMLHTRPDSTIDCGNTPGLTRGRLVDAILAGRARQCMNPVPVAPGDAFLLYAGTMHHADGGVLFYEIMQNSDVYIDLRAPDPALPSDRRRHLADTAADGVDLEDNADFRGRPISWRQGNNTRTMVLACRHFALERLDLKEPYWLAGDGRRFRVLTLIAGRLRIVAGEGVETLDAGQSCLIPAELTAARLEPDPVCSVLQGWTPDLATCIIEPLRARGCADADIIALGGRTARNDLAATAAR